MTRFPRVNAPAGQARVRDRTPVGRAEATIGELRQPADGGDRMNDQPKTRVARLDAMEKRGSFIPVREHLGIHSFGINARTVGEDGTLINEHDEAGGQEEVYVVLDGTATFVIDGATFEAPAGTLVSCQPEAKRSATG